MEFFLIHVIRFVFFGIAGLVTEGVWRGFMQSKPVHWLIHAFLGRFTPFDPEMIKQITRHFRERKILMAHVPMGMFWVYAPGIGPGFDVINWLCDDSATTLGRVLWHIPLYPLCIWLVEIVVGSLVRKHNKDGTSQPRWWNYAETGYWIIKGKRYQVHWRGLIRFDYAPIWVFMGFAMEFLRRVVDPLMSSGLRSFLTQVSIVFDILRSLV